MMPNHGRPHLSALLPIALLIGCSAPPEAESETETCEVEPVHTASVSEALSSIDCTESVATGYSKGAPFPITVVTVDGKPVETATANAYYVMAQAAAAQGVTLKVNSGFRTYEEQQYLYNCYINCNCNNCNLAAKPGYSNHQSGHALDLNTSSGGVYNWLEAHAGSYGFTRTVPSEAWHWEWWGGGPGGGPCNSGPSLTEQIILPLVATFDGSTSTDVDGDGAADVCARHSAGFSCARGSDAGFSDAVDNVGLSNDQGWNAPQYFHTIRMADLNGDGKADLCARGSAGVSCFLSDGNTFPEQLAGPEWSDASGWGSIQFWSTIRLADIDGNGMADICARAAAGIVCHRSTGNGFGDAIQGPALSDASGWAAEQYYGTLRFADVDGDRKMDLCARHSMGFSCWLSDGTGFPTEIVGPALSDASGWGDQKYWATIRMADVNGDGRSDVCARHSAGFSCWLSDGTGFPTEVVGPALSDASGWGDIKYWSTLRVTDIDGDRRADVCARAAASFACWLSKGDSFGDMIAGPDMGDAVGWDKPEHYSTFRVGDTNGDGKAEVCGRGGAGIVCWPFTGQEFGAGFSGPEWSNANGWADLQYYGTLQLAGGCISETESCNGRDDDCDGQVDEDGVCVGTSAGGTSGTGGASGGGPSGEGGSDPGAPDEQEVSGACACSFGTRSSIGGSWSLLLVAVMLEIRRRLTSSARRS